MAHLSKAKRVRKYMAEHEEARPSEVAAALSKHGITAAYVSNIKTAMKKKSGQPLNSLKNGPVSNIENLKAAGVFIKSCGSLERAKAVFQAAVEIVDILRS